MNPLQIIRTLLSNSNRSTQIQAEIREGVANLTNTIVLRSEPDGRVDQSVQLLKEIRAGIVNLADAVNRANGNIGASSAAPVGRSSEGQSEFKFKADRDPTLSAPVRSKAGHAIKAPLPFHVRSGSGHFVRAFTGTNDLGSFANVFDGIEPFAGDVPKGFVIDWAGIVTRGEFLSWNGAAPDSFGGSAVEGRLPPLSDGEGWFEAANWVEAAREAKKRYVMITLGACFGAQAVGAHRMLQMLNPMPSKLVAVEPDPVNQDWVDQHFRDNGIDPADQWIVGSALGSSREPIFFPVGGAGTGSQNSFATNELAAREAYVSALISSDFKDAALRNLLLSNSTGLTKSLLDDGRFEAEIKLVSAVTLEDVLGPFDRVDYLEVDIQQSEIIVFPPFMDLVKKKVRRVHLGTHGRDVHEELLRLFKRDGWEIIFDYRPNDKFETPFGSFITNDGVLTVRNPDLAPI